jgi:hypothetical protein
MVRALEPIRPCPTPSKPGIRRGARTSAGVNIGKTDPTHRTPAFNSRANRPMTSFERATTRRP